MSAKRPREKRGRKKDRDRELGGWGVRERKCQIRSGWKNMGRHKEREIR